MKILLLSLLIICLYGSSSANTNKTSSSFNNTCTGKFAFAAGNHTFTIVSDSTHHRKHKFIAAILAFPLGIFGLHRMYLGTSVGVPLLYIATFGGLFGVVPFIDFVLILLSKDVNTYAHNLDIFMWSRKAMTTLP